VDTEYTLKILQRLERVSHTLARKWGSPEVWEDIYSDMCCAFIKKKCILSNKPLSYIIKTCKNYAINNYLSGKSICSKPRKGLKLISIDSISENIATHVRFEEHIHHRIIVERIFALLTPKQQEVASLIMYGNTEKEIAERLKVSQQRINQVKKEIRSKAVEVVRKKVVI
jgi:RNA polymerase sigma factor (sigma-70 family)